MCKQRHHLQTLLSVSSVCIRHVYMSWLSQGHCGCHVFTASHLLSDPVAVPAMRNKRTICPAVSDTNRHEHMVTCITSIHFKQKTWCYYNYSPIILKELVFSATVFSQLEYVPLPYILHSVPG